MVVGAERRNVRATQDSKSILTIQDKAEETSLYEFLGRVRLTIALDALRELRCWARTADSTRLQHALIQDAVQAHHRRSSRQTHLDKPIVKTFQPKLDAKVRFLF